MFGSQHALLGHSFECHIQGLDGWNLERAREFVNKRGLKQNGISN